MNRAVVFLALLAGFAFTGVYAETVYVDDTLRVGLRSNPGNTETPLEVVTSGADLEVLERGEGYLRVRTASGAVGWVSTVYVTDKMPARRLLEQAKKENAELQAQLRVARGGPAAREGAAQAEQTAVAAETEELRNENVRLAARVAELEAKPTMERWLVPAAAGAGLMVVLFGMGFWLGKRGERQRIARRFNGLEF